MFRQALSELRLHPGRFVATLIAIAISVGFMSAISILVATEEASMAKSNSMALSRADLVVTGGSGVEPVVAEALAELDGVRSATPAVESFGMYSANERTVNATVWLDLAPELRWAELVEGEYPDAAGELAVARHMADELQVSVGDEVTELGDVRYTIVGITDDAKSLWGTVAYGSTGGQPPAWIPTLPVVLDDGADPASVRAAIEAELPSGADLQVQTGEEARSAALVSTTNEFDVFRYLLYGFAAIAALVGMITIANTFTILVAQRRRQLGLLRAVGASGGQVLGRQLIESVLLGLLGSMLGVAVGFGVASIGAGLTGSLYWGLTIRWGELAVAVLVGTVVTVLAAVGPALTASRVRPLEALQAVPTAAQAKRAGVVRIVLCVLFLLGGAGLAVLSQIADPESMMPMVDAVGAGVLLSIGVLGAAPLYVAPVLRGIGSLVGKAHPTARLAFENSARNPRRAASTATALMLAIGLIVTLQVALSSVRETAMDEINESYPLDIAAEYIDGIPAGVADRVAELDGVQSSVVLSGKRIESSYGYHVAVDDHAARQAMGVDATPIPDGVVRFPHSSGPSKGEQFVVGDRQFTVEKAGLYGWSTVGINSATLEELPGRWVDSVLWIKLEDRSSAAALSQVLEVLTADGAVPDLSQSGAQAASLLTQVMNVVLLIMTALLGVAVLIAIVGVGNTLGLSVIERQRESALLRALGMQKGQLRAMLLIEALALVGVGAVIGLLAGLFFGWLGVSTAFRSAGDDIEMKLAMDPFWTFGLIGICLIAACLASILPGRRAANATPTEALAVD